MIKTLAAANRSERDHFRIPRSVQQSIPIRQIYADGVWLVGGKHSKTWRFSDVNYAAASEEDRDSIFHAYCGVLNSLPTDASAKITILNSRLNPVDFERTVLLKPRGDRLDCYRGEINRILTDKAAESNNLVQEKYITLSIAQRKIAESRAYFRRVEGNLGQELWSAGFRSAGRQQSRPPPHFPRFLPARRGAVFYLRPERRHLAWAAFQRPDLSRRHGFPGRPF